MKIIKLYLLYLLFSFNRSEVEVPLAVSYVKEVVSGNFAHALIGDLGQLLFDEGVTLGDGILAGEIHEVFLECHQRIGRADVTDLAGLDSDVYYDITKQISSQSTYSVTNEADGTSSSIYLLNKVWKIVKIEMVGDYDYALLNQMFSKYVAK